MIEQNIIAKYKREYLIKQLHEKLIDCIKNKKQISVHLHGFLIAIRQNIIPVEMYVDEDNFYLEEEMFIVNVQNRKYLLTYNEEDGSYCIEANERFLYIDFSD